jgi:hypothetical protein
MQLQASRFCELCAFAFKLKECLRLFFERKGAKFAKTGRKK